MTQQKKNWQTLRGMRDLLPDTERYWRHLARSVEERAHGLGYGRIETPIVEEKSVFVRSIGEQTDIVSKEMFEVTRSENDLDDRARFSSKETQVLRPEGTAAVIRAYREHGMHAWRQPVKLWYYGPFFRAERPQKGRYRQFWQAGFETIGDPHPASDAILIYLFWLVLNDVGIRDGMIVDINSMGCKICRPKYRKALKDYYEPFKKKLSKLAKERLEKNPLRLLDTKEEDLIKLRDGAPQVIEYLCDTCRDHFTIVLESLDELGVSYNLNPLLVRGFDYYTRTTFEVRLATDERSQNAFGGGGRYDGLVELFGSRATPAVGFAMGVDRIVEEMIARKVRVPRIPRPDIYVIQLGERAKKTCLSIMAHLHEHGFKTLCNPAKDSLKTQLKLAHKAGVRYALIIGQREALDETAILKDMAEGTQEVIAQKEMVRVLEKRVGKK